MADLTYVERRSAGFVVNASGGYRRFRRACGDLVRGLPDTIDEARREHRIMWALRDLSIAQLRDIGVERDSC
jgi:uncharacterized protein YjiS (DUF1127 family)